MIILLDTSTPTCKLTLVDNGKKREFEWQADRQLAKGLLSFLERSLSENGQSLNSIRGLGIMKGPGSFTGLRIGITVFNTIADTNNVPIVGETGDSWQDKAIMRLENGENDHVVLPEYGSEANITKPRK